MTEQPQTHTVSFGKLPWHSVDFALEPRAGLSSYQLGKASVPAWAGYTRYRGRDLACSCGGTATLSYAHTPLFSETTWLSIGHLDANRCRSCGRADPMGAHYIHCGLLEEGDIVMEPPAQHWDQVKGEWFDTPEHEIGTVVRDTAGVLRLQSNIVLRDSVGA